MSSSAVGLIEVIERLPADSTLTLRNVSWSEYERLLDGLGDASGVRLSYDGGILHVMTLSSEHESYSRLIEALIRLLSTKLRIRVLSFGSSTIKKRAEDKGSEPDGCFYVQSAATIGQKLRIDFCKDPPPDIVVEIDIHHESLFKLPVYAALGVPEIWRFDGKTLIIYGLSDGEYVPVESSRALPMLTSVTLTEFLALGPQKDQYDIVLAFEAWLDELR
jgi:Uma2 family endonuclease